MKLIFSSIICLLTVFPSFLYAKNELPADWYDVSDLDRAINQSLKQPVPKAFLNVIRNAPFYRMSISIDEKSHSYDGTMILYYRNNEGITLQDIGFHLYPNVKELAVGKNLQVSEVSINGKTCRFDDRRIFLLVHLNEPLEPGGKVAISMKFHGDIYKIDPAKATVFGEVKSEIKHFLGLSGERSGGYGIFGYTDKTICLAFFHPVLSIYRDGGWEIIDEGGIGDFSTLGFASYDVRLTADSGLKIVSPGSQSSISYMENSIKETRILSAGIREFYIVLSRNLTETVEEEMATGIKIKSYYFKEHAREGVASARISAKALIYFKTMLFPYPYREFRIVEVPLTGGAGGVELSEAVLISSMIYDIISGTGGFFSKILNMSPDSRNLLPFVISHEVAHQWFHGIVGNDSRKAPFLDEACANYFAILFLESAYSKSDAMKIFFEQMIFQYQVMRYMGIQDKPVGTSADSFQDPFAYSAIVYAKGGVFLDRLRKLVGSSTFMKIFKSYVMAGAYRMVEQNLLKTTILGYSKNQSEMEKFYNRWVNESHGDEDIGLPKSIFDLMQSIPAEYME